ncbi:hypothetical protein [Exiguobacterium sp. JLM-2]|uniref:hypothetical protein n=1 Tax=Exiguobacterium sp. JLM-2 TaxID=1647415 RepID=UPI00064B7345|nr:hypothetical protein [Exiguobacterium sp. JLM-2]
MNDFITFAGTHPMLVMLVGLTPVLTAIHVALQCVEKLLNIAKTIKNWRESSKSDPKSDSNEKDGRNPHDPNRPSH